MSITLFVKTPFSTGKAETLNVKKTDTMTHVLETISERTGLELRQVRLTCSGKEYRQDMPETHTRLEEIGINDRQTLFMVSRLNNGPCCSHHS